ncbi:phosphatase PAP2 family protein [bacterium]|nr:phosphatase PAP2 family protein [bacterium]
MDKTRNLFFIILFFILSHQALFSQKRFSFIKEDINIVISDNKKFCSGITDFKRNDLIKLGIITGGTFLLFSVDRDLKQFAQNHKSSQNDKIFNFDSFYGNSYTAGFTLGIYGAGLILKDKNVRRAGLKSMEAFVYSGMVTTVLKILIGRRRPYGGDSNLFFKPFQKESLYKSLPSGHTTVSFAVSSVLAESVDNSLWKIFWYGSAGMVAASRVYHNAHWFSDVVLGGIIGYSVGSFIIKSDDGKLDKSNSHIVKKIAPYFASNGAGLMIRF